MRLARATRNPARGEEDTRPDFARQYLQWGAGPRAAQALVNAARARALLQGRGVPEVEDVRALAPAILRHRVVLSYAAEADAVTADRVTQDMLRKVPCPGLSDRDDRPSWIRRVFEAIWYGPERRRSA